jgi:hypothetical protein
VRADAADEAVLAPYGVVDRVTLSPAGRAMAMQQRAALPGNDAPKILTYGPGQIRRPASPLLPYTPAS